MVRLIHLFDEVFMRKWVSLLLLIIILLLPFGARAQDSISLSSLEIQIWPEYDKPSVLVIYQMTLSASTTFPISLSVRIPIAAGEPNAVAAKQVDGTLYNISYTRQVAGEWAIISFSTTTPDIQLEYYDPGLIKEGNARHYQYLWPGDYASNQTTIEVQQPAGATDMRISPSLSVGTTGSDNLTYYREEDIGAISAGQNISITIDYNKSTDTLSAENLPVQPSAAIPQSTASDLNVSTWLPWILGILGAGLILGGIIWFWQSGRQRPASKSRRRRSKASEPEPGLNLNTAEDGIYCAQCGKRAAPGDLYCRSCGTPIHSKQILL
jgi:hypothetical protein